MQRDKVDREFYETLTYKIRFNTYKMCQDKYNLIGIFMGQHMDDLIENIFMNIMNGKHILDLCGMKEIDMQQDVLLLRPFLQIHKCDIYEFAKIFNILYTKNTTPLWSCRGAMRENIFPMLANQFGNFQNHLMTLGKQSLEFNASYSKKIEFVFDKIIFQKNGCKINVDDLFEETETFWTRLLLKVFHSMKTNMTKIKTIKQFIQWISKKNQNNYHQFTNNYGAVINVSGLYIIRVFSIHDWTIKTSPIHDLFEQKVITYDDILIGKIQYICTKKLFANVGCLRAHIPKYFEKSAISTITL